MIHIFDVDYTLVRRSTSWYFLLEALEQRVIRFRQIRQLPFEWFRYKAGFPNQDFIEETVKHLRGISRDVLENLAAACFTRRLKPNIYSEGRRLIEDLRRRGETVMLATSSFYTLLRPLEEFLGITESIASRLEFIDGKTSGRLAGSSLFGANKKTAVEHWLGERSISPEAVWFYSDSYTDIPLLEWCGHPAAVNPDRHLAREAKRRGWNILRFRATEGCL
ncbi:MAG: HAD-IB family hydrolase [Treponema sp.]|jgi:HAD superfamily hydrolase (TIGR01490 family)|nr:HAD-IB family hydrolase [Treponema sp.]